MKAYPSTRKLTDPSKSAFNLFICECRGTNKVIIEDQFFMGLRMRRKLNDLDCTYHVVNSDADIAYGARRHFRKNVTVHAGMIQDLLRAKAFHDGSIDAFFYDVCSTYLGHETAMNDVATALTKNGVAAFTFARRVPNVSSNVRRLLTRAGLHLVHEHQYGKMSTFVATKSQDRQVHRKLYMHLIGCLGMHLRRVGDANEISDEARLVVQSYHGAKTTMYRPKPNQPVECSACLSWTVGQVVRDQNGGQVCMHCWKTCPWTCRECGQQPSSADVDMCHDCGQFFHCDDVGDHECHAAVVGTKKKKKTAVVSKTKTAVVKAKRKVGRNVHKTKKKVAARKKRRKSMRLVPVVYVTRHKRLSARLAKKIKF